MSRFQLLLLTSTLALAATALACGPARSSGGGNDDGSTNNGGPFNNGGNNGGDTSCETFAACGGDVVGTWELIAFCGDLEAPTSDDCPTATFDFDLTFTGTTDVRADGTYSSSFTPTLDATVLWPLSCLGGGTCDQLAEALSSEDAAWSCADAGEQCECHYSQTDAPSEDSGTWSVDGNVFTTVSDEDGESQSLDFCVQGDIIKVRGDEEDEIDGVMVMRRR